jgi:hypothetical protein
MPKRNENGTPTNCTIMMAAMSVFCSMPISVPYAVAIRMIVPMPSL